jgi:predicted dehydrogenase
MDFENGAIGQITTSFDVWHSNLPCIEIHGSLGSLSVPDPNSFGGPVKIRKAGDSEWREVALTHGYAENSRGLGVLDMALAISNKREHRASGDLAFHVLDAMHAFHEASNSGQHVTLQSSVAKPAPMPNGTLES